MAEEEEADHRREAEAAPAAGECWRSEDVGPRQLAVAEEEREARHPPTVLRGESTVALHYNAFQGPSHF